MEPTRLRPALPEAEVAKLEAAFHSSAVGDLERAVSLWSDLSLDHPDEAFFAFQRLNSLFEIDRTVEGVAAFEDIQRQDPLSTRCRTLHTLLGRDSVAYPKEFQLVEGGSGRLDRHAGYWSFVKLSSGLRHLALTLDSADGVLVEGLVGKRVGDDECCRVEVDNGVQREVVVFNARTVGLRSSSQAIRLSFDRRLRPFRLVVKDGAARLWIDGTRLLRSDALVPTRNPGLRIGLVESIDNLDTDFMLGCVRVGIGLKGDSIDDFAPCHGWEAWTATFADWALRAGRSEESAMALEASLGGRPKAPIIEACVDMAVRLAEERRPDAVKATHLSVDDSLQRIAARLRALDRPAEADRVAVKTEKPGALAVVCDRVSVLFARAPHRVTQPVEIIRRLMDPKKYHAENYRRAVEDVSFDLRYGSVLGIIGNNGAGKSTLLRAIAGIVDYEGLVQVNGRSRLLVMGVGIQDELTGKENIRLGCLYLGMRRREIARRVPEILEFAELTEAQDLPYRYYSDGMKARLLFSIATSVEPDILLLDELLGAGDVRFRAKATARMEQLIERSKAMIVVTHNLSFVRERATQVLYMDRGRVRYLGDPHRAVDLYFDDNRLTSSAPDMEDRKSLTEEI